MQSATGPTTKESPDTPGPPASPYLACWGGVCPANACSNPYYRGTSPGWQAPDQGCGAASELTTTQPESDHEVVPTPFKRLTTLVGIITFELRRGIACLGRATVLAT